MSYKHGIEVAEKATSLKTPLSTEYAAQVIFGTAPVNLAEYPEKAVNTPIMAIRLRRLRQHWAIPKTGRITPSARAWMQAITYSR